MNNVQNNIFELSKTKSVKGTRRLVREKALQILFAYEQSETDYKLIFQHIFDRMFNVDDDFESQENRLLKPDEIREMEADILINWKEDERDFAINLLNFTREMKREADALIESFSNNWESERIAVVDRIIIRLAIAEMIHFPHIPIKVTLNEAIELAKAYSTPKSSVFINGILDTIKVKLLNEDRIKKEGKGLIEDNN